MKDPLKIMGFVRMCKRHKDYVKECPKCQVVARIEEHQPNAQNIKVQVPVYRKTFINKNKYVQKGKNEISKE